MKKRKKKLVKKTLKGSSKLILTSVSILGSLLFIYLLGQQNYVGKFKPNKQVEIKINNCTLFLNKAESTFEKENGLMFITSMSNYEGMIFLYDEPDYQSFWMLNTFIPLDIIYIDENNKIIAIYNNTKPLDSNTLYNSPSKSKSVIELKANITKLCKINVQDFTNF
jgi:uncharacterized membrane protein (UPF0127 family)